MTCLRRGAVVLAIVILTLFQLSVRAAVPPSDQPLAKALDPNPGLLTYRASATLVAKVRALVPVQKTLHGTVMYRKPVRKIVFNDVPGPLKQFTDLIEATPTYEELKQSYHFLPNRDDGYTTTYTLFPLTMDRRVRTIYIRVSDREQLVKEAVWTYNDGSGLTIRPRYEAQGGFHLLAALEIEARFPEYRVDGTLRFSDYQLGVPVDL